MISINSVSNVFYSTASNNYIDVTLNTLEYGYIPCTLSNSDNTIYKIFDSNTNTYLNISNKELFLSAANGNHGNVSSFSLNVPIAKQTAYDQITNVCDFISTQIIPSQTKQFAYQSALMILNVNSGNPPTSEPFANSFNQLALSWGMNSNNFANLIITMQNMSLSLAGLEFSTQNQINNAQNANQILTIITTFENTINTTMTEINSILPIPISSPPSIIIRGINA